MASLTLVAAACSSETHGGAAGGGGQAPTTASSAATGGASASSAGGGGGGPSTGSGGGGQGPCLEITLSAFRRVIADGANARYEATATPDQGAMAADVLVLEFYGSASDPSNDGDQNGTFDLSAGLNSNYSTCSQCLYVRVDNRIKKGAYFQASGTIDVHADSDTVHGAVDATLTDVTLVEVTFDANAMTTPVPGGRCVHITSAEAVRSLIPPPPGWTCTDLYYGDGQCSCGCGVVDVDCADATLQSCEFCQDTGSCSTSACPGTIDPTNNAQCM